MFNSLTTQWKSRLTRFLPGQLVVQITDRCNATCPQCSMRVTEKFTRSSLTRKQMEQIMDAAGTKKIKAISFTGGEPFIMADDLMQYMKRAGDKKIPFIRTGTNGFYFTGSHRPGFRDKVSRLAERLAATPVRNFWISIDSSDPELHGQMRGFDNLFEGIARALPIFQDAGIYPSVNLGINRNLGGAATRDLYREDFSSEKEWKTAVYQTYRKAFGQFYETVIDLGFTIANACYPMSVDETSTDLDPVYQASAVDRVIRFTRTEKAQIFKALSDTIPEYRSRIRIFSPRVSLHALVNEYSGQTDTSYPCLGGISYFFIDSASGDTFPCGYRGHDNFGKFHESGRALDLNSSPCRRCDWECFRDPSELIGPVLDLLTAPGSLLKKIFSDPVRFRLWAQDLLYYRACDYFNGRKAPDYKKLGRFS